MINKFRDLLHTMDATGVDLMSFEIRGRAIDASIFLGHVSRMLLRGAKGKRVSRCIEEQKETILLAKEACEKLLECTTLALQNGDESFHKYLNEHVRRLSFVISQFLTPEGKVKLDAKDYG